MRNLKKLFHAPFGMGFVLLLLLSVLAAVISFDQGFQFLAQVDQMRFDLVARHVQINQLNEIQSEALVFDQVFVVVLFVFGIGFSTLAVSMVREMRRASRHN